MAYKVPPGYLSTSEAAARLGTDRNVFLRMVRHLRIPAHTDPHNRNYRLYLEEDVERMRRPIPVATVGPMTPPESCPAGHLMDRVYNRARGVNVLVCRLCDFMRDETPPPPPDVAPPLPGFGEPAGVGN